MINIVNYNGLYIFISFIKFKSCHTYVYATVVICFNYYRKQIFIAMSHIYQLKINIYEPFKDLILRSVNLNEIAIKGNFFYNTYIKTTLCNKKINA